MHDLNLIGIVGSLRSESVNGAIARATSSIVPPAAALTLHDVRDVPLYTGDVEAAGLPDSVTALHEAVRACDGLVLFSPEYNGSFPAVTKNVIDWLSRPPRSWERTPITMVTASPGPRAGAGVRDHFSAIMAFQPTRLFETFGIGAYGEKLDANGNLADEATLEGLASFMGRFCDFCRSDP